MKIADLTKVAALPQEPTVVELKPSSRYIMLIKGTRISDASREHIERYLLENQHLHVTVIGTDKDSDISFYELKTGAVDKSS